MKTHRLPFRSAAYLRATSTRGNSSSSKFVNKAQSGKSNFEKDFEKSHIRTNLFQKLLLGLGSSFVSITSPSRGDMIAVMGEVTGYQALEYMRAKMADSEEGRKILDEKPRISSGSIDLEKLKSYPEGTLGKAYSNFLEKYGYTPDTRNAVQFVDDLELAYIAQRYRETHDLVHTLLDMPTNMLGEVTVKWVEAIQFKMPMCVTGALFGAVRLAPKFSRAYSTKPVIKLNEAVAEKITSHKLSPKKHPGVSYLPRVTLPKDIWNTMKDISKHRKRELSLAADQLFRTLRHRVLPLEADDRKRLYREFFDYYRNKLPPEVEWNEQIEDKIRNKTLKKLKTVNGGKPLNINKTLALAYMWARAPAEYAVLKRVFNEIYQKDNDFAPTSLLDFGSGVGTVTWAAYDFWGETLKEYYCVDASADMNELAAMILRRNNIDGEPFIKTVYFRQFFPATPRLFDIVVSSFSFFDLKNCEQRLRMLTALWNDTKEYLVLIEEGTNWGFQVITEARDFLLNISKEQGIDCHIFAPCPHDKLCPRLFAEGRKSPCNFLVKFKKFTHSISDDSVGINFSYVIFRKKPPPPDLERNCRIVRKVQLRHKHVVCKVCSNEGKLLDLFVTASKHGKPAYTCVRASKWGDSLPGPLVPREIEFDEKSAIADSDICNVISDSSYDNRCDKEEIVSDSDSDSDNETQDSGCSDTEVDKNK